MKRINAYSKPSGDGGVAVDIEGLLVDGVMVAKAGGMTWDDWLKLNQEIWRGVEVEVTIPERAKN